VSPAKQPTDLAASVRARLLNLARRRGEEFQLVLSEFAFEMLLEAAILHRGGATRKPREKQTIAEFLNTEGGDLLIGVADDGSIAGSGSLHGGWPGGGCPNTRQGLTADAGSGAPARSR
jgi:hypothetical protein